MYNCLSFLLFFLNQFSSLFHSCSLYLPFCLNLSLTIYLCHLFPPLLFPFSCPLPRFSRAVILTESHSISYFWGHVIFEFSLLNLFSFALNYNLCVCGGGGGRGAGLSPSSHQIPPPPHHHPCHPCYHPPDVSCRVSVIPWIISFCPHQWSLCGTSSYPKKTKQMKNKTKTKQNSKCIPLST